jgi:transposase
VRRGVEKNDSEEPEHHDLGRSGGGFSTKVHIICDSTGIPIEIGLTPGQEHESTVLESLVDKATSGKLDEPEIQVKRLAGDKAYRSNQIDEYLLKKKIEPVIPNKVNSASSRPDCDKEQYKKRNIIERLIGWLKENRRILVRYEKTSKNFLGMIRMAIIVRLFKKVCD